MFETKTRMIKIISMVMMSCRLMLLLKTSPEADDGGLGGGGDDMRAADRFFLPPLPTGTTAKYLQISFFFLYSYLYKAIFLPPLLEPVLNWAILREFYAFHSSCRRIFVNFLVFYAFFWC